jgi:hypothetical protein
MASKKTTTALVAGKRASKKTSVKKTAAKKPPKRQFGRRDDELEKLILGWLTVPKVSRLLAGGKAEEALALLHIDNPELAALLNQVDVELIGKIIDVAQPPRLRVMG